MLAELCSSLHHPQDVEAPCNCSLSCSEGTAPRCAGRGDVAEPCCTRKPSGLLPSPRVALPRVVSLLQRRAGSGSSPGRAAAGGKGGAPRSPRPEPGSVHVVCFAPRTGTCPAGRPWCGSSSRASGSSGSSLAGSARRYSLFSCTPSSHAVSFHLLLCSAVSLRFAFPRAPLGASHRSAFGS